MVSLAEVTEVEAMVETGMVDSVSEVVTFGDSVTVVGKLEVEVPVSTEVELSEIVSVGTIEEVNVTEPVGEDVGSRVSVLFAEIVTSAPVALLANDVMTDEPEPVVTMEPLPEGVAEEIPVAVPDPVPGPVNPPVIVEAESLVEAEPEPVAEAKILLVALERSEVMPPRSELRMPLLDAVALGEAVDTAVPVPGPVTPPEIVEEASVAADDAAVLGPVTPPEMVEEAADESDEVPRRVLVKLDRSEVTPPSRELRTPPLEDAAGEAAAEEAAAEEAAAEESGAVVSAAAEDAAVAPVLGPVTPPEIVEEAAAAEESEDEPRRVLVRLKRSELTPPRRELRTPPLDDAVVAAGAVVVLAPVPAPVIPETVVSVSELEVVSLVGVAEELATPVPAPVADASIVDAVSASVVETAVSLATVVDAVDDAPVVAPVADTSIVELESVEVARTLEISEIRSLVRELRSPPVDAVVVAAAVSMVEVVSAAEDEAVAVGVVSVDAESVEETMIPLEVCETSVVVSEAVEDTMPVGAITIEVKAEDVGVAVLPLVVSSTVEASVEPDEEAAEEVPLVVSELEARSDESKLESEVEPGEFEFDPCEEDESLFVRLCRMSVKDRPWDAEEAAVVTSMLEDGTADEEKVVTVTLVYALLTSRGKYILGLATGSALASVDTAASAVTRSDFDCIL